MRGPGCSRSARPPAPRTGASRRASSARRIRGRTWAFDATIDAAIARLTPAEVNATLAKYLKPDAFAYAFAGDFK